MTLNNDVRISPGYFAGLLDPRLPGDAGLVTGLYDDTAQLALWPTIPADVAAHYSPRPRYRPLTCADGTGLVLTRDLWLAIGGLDDRSFGRFSWGADIDLSIRATDAGFGIHATEMSFLNHLKRQTARAVMSDRRYRTTGGFSMSRGLWRVHGDRWRDTVVTDFEVIDLDDHQVVESWNVEQIAMSREPLVEPTPSPMRRAAVRWRRFCATSPVSRG